MTECTPTHPWTGPDYPDFHQPRDGGHDMLRAPWRLQDQVQEALGEGRAAQAPGLLITPILGVAAHLLRGMVVLCHDHPEITRLGTGAVFDGNVLLLHRGLVEALSNASVNTTPVHARTAKEKSAPQEHCDFLLSFLAQAAMANARQALGLSWEHQEEADREYWAGSIAATALPAHLSLSKQLQFVSPGVLHRALDQVFQHNGTADEICGQLTPVADDAIEQRRLCRVADAIKQARTEQAIEEDLGNNLSTLMPGLVREGGVLGELKMAAAKLQSTQGPLAYQPLSAEDLGQYHKWPGADACYSQHLLVNTPALLNASLEDLWQVARALPDTASPSVWYCAGAAIAIHAHGLARSTEAGDQVVPVARAAFLEAHKEDKVAANPHERSLVNGMIRRKGFGGVHYTGKAYQQTMAMRIVTACSLMGRGALDIDPNLLDTLEDRQLVQLFQAAGDAMHMWDGKHYRKNITDKILGAMTRETPDVSIGETQLVMEWGHPEVAKQLYRKLDALERGAALRHAACNRYALDLLPALLDCGRVALNDTHGTGETVAHLLLDRVGTGHLEKAGTVLRKLLDHGLDPATVNHRGLLAGEGPGDRSHLLPADTLQRAASEWQYGQLGQCTEAEPPRPARRSRL